MDQNINTGELSLRRLRKNHLTRELVQEIQLSEKNFVQPYFVVDGIANPQPIAGLTDNYRETSESILNKIESDIERGVRKILLFGVPQKKHATEFNYDFICNEINSIKKRFGDDIWVATDVCLCSSTNHGQCGIIKLSGDAIDNQKTVRALTEQAVLFAQAGTDCIAPSDMMDGRIHSIRTALNKNGFEDKIIMSYAAKFNSNFYGPFREAANSAPKGDIKLKDRSTYQIDFARPTDALLSSIRDYQEGADILMIKPGLPYLDVLKELSSTIKKPWAAYEVSGEYAAIELMAKQGLTSGPQAHLESWTALKRAGASIIISYGSRYARQWIQGDY